MFKKMNLAKRTLSVLLSALLVSTTAQFALAADGTGEYGSLVDPDVAACESSAALSAFSSAAVGSQAREISADAHDGAGSVKVTISSTNLSYVSFRPTAKLVEGETYYFSVWYKDARSTTDGKIELRGRTASAAISISGAAQTIKSNGWVKYVTPVTITQQMANDLTFFYLTSGDLTSMGDIYFDDISFEKIDPDSENLVNPYVAECESDYSVSSMNGFLADSAIKKEISSDYHNSGNSSIKVTKTVSNNYCSLIAFKPTVKLVEGEKYYFSVWYNNANGDAGSNQFEFVGRTSSGIPKSSQVLTSASGWQKYECVFTADADFANNLQFFYMRSANFVGTIYFDDITLKKYDNMVDFEVSKCESANALNGLKSEVDDASKITREIDYNYNHSGNGSVKVTKTAACYNSMIAFKPMTKLVEGADYYFSVWYNNANGDAGNNQFEFVGRTSSGIPKSSQVLSSASGWQKYECTFTADADFANNLKFFYIRSNGFIGTIYFDDISLVQLPEKTQCVTDDLGEVELGGIMNIAFDNNIDETSLPKTALVDGDTIVNVNASLSKDDKTVAMAITSQLDEGVHSISFDCKDAWGRSVNATTSFTLVYGNLIAANVADCESDYALNEFNTNNYNGGAREITTDYAHSGFGSLKYSIVDGYNTFAGVKPVISLVEGERYTFSVWYYNPENITGRMFLRFTSITGNSISNWVTGTAFDSGINMSNGGWNKYEFTFTATNKLANDLKYLYITTENGKGKTIYFDDFSLYKLGSLEISADVYDEADQIVSAWKSGDLKAKVTMKNKSYKDEECSGIVIFANYNKGQLVNANIANIDEIVAPNETTSKSVELNVTSGDTLKVFLWDSLTNCAPLMPVVQK